MHSLSNGPIGPILSGRTVHLIHHSKLNLFFPIVFKTLFTYEKNKVNEGFGSDESHDKGEAYDDGVGYGSHMRG